MRLAPISSQLNRVSAYNIGKGLVTNLLRELAFGSVLGLPLPRPCCMSSLHANRSVNPFFYCLHPMMGAGPQVKNAYRTLAAKHHPDNNPGSAGAEKYFHSINDAYDVSARHFEVSVRYSISLPRARYGA